MLYVYTPHARSKPNCHCPFMSVESGPQVFLSTGPVEQPSAPELELWLTQEALTQSGRSLPFVLGNPSSPTFLTSMRTD